MESAWEWRSPSGFGRYLDALHATPLGRIRAGRPVRLAPSGTPGPAAVAPPAPSPPPSSAGDPVVDAAGDIACDPANGPAADSCHAMAVSDLILAHNPQAVLTLGDNQYESNTIAQYMGSYALSFGRFKPIIHPGIGNHEYLTQNAAGYFGYFGAAAGDPTKGYYSFDLGGWHIVSLNSECSHVGGCDAQSPQGQWLAQDLAAHPAACTLAYWHEPRFSSGQHGSNQATGPLWQELYDAGAEIVLSGHDHDYERFSPLDPSGRPDPARGIRQFVVGTGGKNHYVISGLVTGSEVRNDSTFGFLELRLHPRSYDWTFVPEPGKTFTDSGSGTCH